MNSKSSRNEILFARIKKLVSTERRIGVEILECLYEIEKRKAYAELRYDGLYTYCVKELCFTESQAYQRIQAMRAMKELPELKPMIESGSLSVSSVSKVQTHLKREKKKAASAATVKKIEGTNVVEKEEVSELQKEGLNETQKLEKFKLFQSMENRTSREVDQKLAEARGEKLKEKLILELDEEAAVLWKQVQDLSAHKNQSEKISTFKMLMREWLKRNHPAREVRTPVRAKTHADTQIESAPKAENLAQTATVIATETKTETVRRRSVSLLTWKTDPCTRGDTRSRAGAQPKTDSRSIPLPLKREVWRRDQSKCSRCGSTYALEIDHIRPFALGGKTEKENLRLLCRSCNGYAAIQVFGTEALRGRVISQPV